MEIEDIQLNKNQIVEITFVNEDVEEVMRLGLTKENVKKIVDFYNTFIQVSQKKLTPNSCPICYGKGIVPGGFYTSVSSQSITTNTTEKCRQCDGQGILWS